MRDDTTTNLYIAEYVNGIAPQRHKLARHQYVETLKSLHEAEQRAATTGRVLQAMAQLWDLMSVAFAPRFQDAPASRQADLPAE